MPFQASTELIGTSASDLLVTELLRTGRYQLVERSQLSQVLNEAEVALSGLSEAQAVELGNMLGADGVIIGTVDEYGSIANRGKTLAVVGLSVRLIDCASGRVMWSASYATTAKDHRTALSQHARMVVRGTVVSLASQWHVQRQVSRTGGADVLANAQAPIRRTAPEPRPAPTPPPAPAGYRADDFGLREVRLQWSAPVDRTLRYRIERGPSSTGPFITVATVSATQGQYRDAGDRRTPLADAATYYYRFVAVAQSGLESPAGPLVESMTAPPPDPVRKLLARSGEVRTIPLSWPVSPEPEVVSYTIYRAETETGPYTLIATIQGRERTAHVDGNPNATPLADGRTYYYRIRAVNSVGADSADSDSARGTTRDPPPKVDGLTAVSHQPRMVPLAWNMSPDDQVTGYEISRSVDGVSFVVIGETAGRNAVSYEDHGDMTGRGSRARLQPLQDGAPYHYRGRAFNTARALSDWSAVTVATTKVIPSTPVPVSASEGRPGMIEITWKTNPEMDIAAYLVAASASASQNGIPIGRVEVLRSPPLSFSEAGLAPGLERYYRVRAVDQDGLESTWSAPIKGTTKSVPDAPENVRFEWVDGMAVATWDPPPQTDIVKYRLVEQRRLGRGATWESGTNAHFFLGEEVAKRLMFSVVAVDADGLESPPGKAVEIRAVP